MFFVFRLIVGICTLAVGVRLYRLEGHDRGKVLEGRLVGVLGVAGKAIGGLCFFMNALLVLPLVPMFV